MKKVLLSVLLVVINVITLFSVNKNDTTKTIQLSNVEITGGRPSLVYPISEKTVTLNYINKENYGQEMGVFLEKTPSITTQSDGGNQNGYMYFRLRGIDQTRINVTLNGSPLNDQEDQAAYYSNYPNFLINLKSVQIQRGVGTSSNGTSSFGGSINFEGKDGLDTMKSVTLSNGSFGTKVGNVTYSTGLLKNNFAFVSSLSMYKSDGYRYHSGGSGFSGYISGGYYTKNDVIKLTSFTGKSNNDMAWLASPKDSITKDSKHNPLPDTDKDQFTQTFVQLQQIHNFSNNSVNTNTLYYNRLDGKYDVFGTKIGLGSNFYGFMSNYNYKQKSYNLNVGVHLNTYSREHFDYVSYNNTGTKNEVSAYFKPEYIINDFNIYGDFQLRTTKFSYSGDTVIKPITWTFFNPRVGTTYKITSNQNLYTSIGLSHREPTRTDMFGGSDNLITLNPLKPESVVDYELGYRYNTNKLKLNVNLYFMDFTNELTLVGAVGTNSLSLMTSVEKSYRSGVEFDGKYIINKHFSISNNTILSRNNIVGDNKNFTPLYTPSFITNQDVEYNNKGFYGVLSCRFVSKSYINLENTSYCPSYYTINTKLGYNYKSFDISVNGVNITNTKYYTGGYVDMSGDNYFIGTPISFYATLKYNF